MRQNKLSVLDYANKTREPNGTVQNTSKKYELMRWNLLSRSHPSLGVNTDQYFEKDLEYKPQVIRIAYTLYLYLLYIFAPFESATKAING